jgi:hypothetical protein
LNDSESFDITAEQVSEGIRCSAIHGGYLIHRLYIGYSKEESIQLFTEYLKTL